MALDTNAGTVNVTNRDGANGVQCWADADWLYCDVTGGTYLSVKAYQVMTVPFRGDLGTNLKQSFFAKVASGTATLYMMGV